jgi:hypothetical protein
MIARAHQLMMDVISFENFRVFLQLIPKMFLQYFQRQIIAIDVEIKQQLWT